ncbi:cholesterol oxidase [Entomortierella parvispora]|uniref:Cholesterol oxidase n=1 Tax=Entomortierella parvispora TaxID=205924 RepID=A0A9P3LXY5_9FUNG|nr:cholesterol oxidase [Entomortierella parvispora]
MVGHKQDVPRRPPRISSPLTKLKSHYDAIVVGSGYGASIAASRLARAGRRVCILERGEERWPGEYPEDTLKAASEVQFNGESGHEGKRTGLYEIHKNKDQWAFVACGLGGTSLLNANTALKPEPRLWDDKSWPEEVTQDRALLDQSFQHAYDMLQPNPYPEDWPVLPKLATLEQQAKGAGAHDKFVRPPITVHFEDALNPAGVFQKKSTLTGNDTTGVNDWSKNTTLMNYIPDAWNHGAEIFTCCNVVRVEKAKKKLQSGAGAAEQYVVYFEWQEESREGFLLEHGASIAPMFVTADIVVLGAGALGSSEILLRSNKCGLPTSDQLGKHFSGNGDFLAFSYNGETLVNGVSMGDEDPKSFENKVGPVITGLIDYRDTPNVMDGYVVEEGAIPAQAALFLRTIYQVMSDTSSKSLKTAENLSFQEKVNRNARELSSYVAGVYRGAMANTQTFLVMSHDDARGELSLKEDRIRIAWPGVGSSRNFSRLDRLLEPLAEAVRGTYVRDPLTAATEEAVVTVHPIGGCSMARSGAEGVINHKGQVFTGQGTEVYEGLYVMDGAVMPMSLGVNPFLTISALAERAVALLARDRGWTIKYDPTLVPIDFKTPQFPIPYNELEANPEAAALAQSLKQSALQDVADLDGEVRGLVVSEPYPADSSSSDSDSDDKKDEAKPSRTLPSVFSTWGKSLSSPEKKEERKKTGVSFTEMLRGHLSTVILTDDFDTADAQARSSGSTLNVVLTLSTGPIEEFLKKTNHRANIVGTASCRALSDQPMMIESGVFTIYTGTEDDPSDDCALIYKMVLLCASGERYRFEGRKPIKTGHVLEGWIKPSKVLVTVYKYEDGVEKVYGRGKLGEHDGDFFTQITSLRGDSTSLGANLRAIKEFGTSTINATVKSYLPFLNELAYPEDPHKKKTYDRQRPEPQVFDVLSSDGFKTRLTRYKGKKGPVLLLHGASVSSEIFSTNLIPHNLCDYLLAHDYDVWLSDWRMSKLVAASTRQSNIYGGAHDHKAAIQIVLKETGVKNIQVIAHCVGSVTLWAGMLNGEIEGVGSVVSSQVSTHPMLSTANKIKQSLQLVTLFEKVLQQDEFNCLTHSPDASPVLQSMSTSSAEAPAKEPTMLDRAIDNTLRLMPMPDNEYCNNAICHRASFCFGLLWEHDMISKNFHDNLDEIMGSINIESLKGLVTLWSKKQTLTDAEGTNVVTDENFHRSVFDKMPVLFIHGAKNQVFTPESTVRSLEELRNILLPPTGMTFDYKGLYRRELIPGYGHLDCIVGDRAYKDVYPFILDHLETYSKTTGYGAL